MITKRKYKRYHAATPIRIVAHGTEFLAHPRDIGLGGCYFDFPKPFEGHVERAFALLDDQSTIDLPEPEIIQHTEAGEGGRKRNGCFGIQWKLPPADAARLQIHLESTNADLSGDKKADFIINEQKILADAITDIEKTKLSRMRILLTAIIAYLSFFAVPYKILSPLTNELGGLYAIGGIWISVSLVFYSDRTLKFLGTAYKLKAIYYKSMNLNRSIIMRNDALYYSSTLFPIGIEYDKSRRHPYDASNPELEKHPTIMKYNRSTTFYFIFIQLLFVIGFVYYVSILMRSMQNGPFYQTIDTITKLNMIDYTAYQIAFVTCSGLILLWIQTCIMRCEQYQKRIWEAKRVSALRPNPQFSGAKFREKGYFLWPLKIMQYAAFTYGGMAIVFGASYLKGYPLPKGFSSLRIYRFDVAIGICIIYFLVRWLFSYIKMDQETEADAAAARAPVETGAAHV